MLLFVIHHLWSIIGDSGFVVSLILPSTVALLSFHRSTGKLGSRPLGTSVCRRPSPACYHRPFQGPRPRSTLETPPAPLQRADLQRQQRDTEVLRGPGGGGFGGALPQTPGQKYRLIYLSAILGSLLQAWSHLWRAAWT